METKELAKKAVHVITGNGNNGHAEGETAKAIEQETAKMPSDIFLWTGLSCLGASAIFRVIGLRSLGQLIGQLAAPVLIMGLYNKVVKLHGSEKKSDKASLTGSRSGKDAGSYSF